MEKEFWEILKVSYSKEILLEVLKMDMEFIELNKEHMKVISIKICLMEMAHLYGTMAKFMKEILSTQWCMAKAQCTIPQTKLPKANGRTIIIKAC